MQGWQARLLFPTSRERHLNWKSMLFSYLGYPVKMFSQDKPGSLHTVPQQGLVPISWHQGLHKPAKLSCKLENKIIIMLTKSKLARTVL